MRNNHLSRPDRPFKELPPWKEMKGELVLALFLLAWFLLLPSALFAEPEVGTVSPEILKGEAPALESKGTSKSAAPDSLKGRVVHRVPTFPFSETEVFQAYLGYGMQLEILVPEKIKNIVHPSEQFISADYVENKAYLKGIAYAVGESTNIHINLESGKTLHMRLTLVEPERSDDAIKFVTPSKEVFGESFVKKEIAKEREKVEGELKKREANLSETANKISEEQLKSKLLREQKKQVRKKRIKNQDLEMLEVEQSVIRDRMYVKFVLKNRSKRDYEIGALFLSRSVPDPKNSGKVLGFEEIQMDEPTLELAFVPAQGQTKVLLAFGLRELQGSGKLDLKIAEAGTGERVTHFKDVKVQ